MTIKREGKFTTITRDDGKIVVASDVTYDHIGTHGKVGKGSVFSGGITPEMINDFLMNADVPASGGALSADFPGGGYLLVKPYESAMKLENATVTEGSKENFDPKQKKMVPVAVAEVHTTQPIEDFKTDETTVLVFPYDPGRSHPDQNTFVESKADLSDALAEKRLYALATAYPGGSEVEGQRVPPAPDWGGMDNPKWVVIIPDSTGDAVMESWKFLAGLK